MARLVEYFATIGLAESELEPLAGPVDHAFFAEQRARSLVEVAVIFPGRGEEAPEGFEVLEGSLNYSGFFRTHEEVLLCFRRSAEGLPLTGVDVRPLSGPEDVPEGWEAVWWTPGGHQAMLCASKRPMVQELYVVFRRQAGTPAEHFHVRPPIMDIALVTGRNERGPHGFERMPTNLNRRPKGKGSPVHLWVLKGVSSGVCDHAYRPSTLQHLPEEPHEDFPFPTNELPMFCFPYGIGLEHRFKGDCPMPFVFTLCLTDGAGTRIYASCLTFYEPAAQAVQEALAPHSDGGGSSSGGGAAAEEAGGFSTLQGDPDTVFAPKCVLVLSRVPFLNSFQTFLKQVFRVSLSRSPVALELYIAALLGETPLPRPGCAARLDLMRGAMPSIPFAMPPLQSLPLADVSYRPLLQCLSVSSLLSVFAHVLLERKVVLRSRHPSIPPAAVEAIRLLMFPLDWQCCFVPRLPESLSSYLEAPGAFFGGIDVSVSQEVWAAEMPDVCVVDMDTNEVFSQEVPAISARSLPTPLAAELRKRLEAIAANADIRLGGGCPDNIDSAFAFAPTPDDGDGEARELDDLLVRDAFFQFMCGVLASYRSFLVPPTVENSRTGDTRSWFDVPAWLAAAPPAQREFCTQLADTQSFFCFVAERTESADPAFVFFDDAVRLRETLPRDASLVLAAQAGGHHDELVVVAGPEAGEASARGPGGNWPSLDASFFPNSDAPVAAAEKRGTSTMLQRSQHELLGAPSGPIPQREVVQVFGSWFLCMPSLLLGASMADQEQLVNAGLAALARLKALGSADEAIYRSVLVACGRAGHSCSNKAVAVFQQMRDAGISPNAVTYGQYAKAVAEVKQQATSAASSLSVLSADTWTRMGLEYWQTETHAVVAAMSPVPRHGSFSRSGSLMRQASSRSHEPFPQPPSIPEAATVAPPAPPARPQTLAMWCNNACEACGHRPLDEEIMAGWARNNCSRVDIVCPRCVRTLTPRLGVVLGGEEQLVDYMPPSLLRSCLEMVVKSGGEGSLQQRGLREGYPELFFNLAWFCHRLDLPLPLRSEEALRSPLMAVGWSREDALAKAAALEREEPLPGPWRGVLAEATDPAVVEVLRAVTASLVGSRDARDSIKAAVKTVIRTRTLHSDARYAVLRGSLYRLLLRLIVVSEQRHLLQPGRGGKRLEHHVTAALGWLSANERDEVGDNDHPIGEEAVAMRDAFGFLF